MLPQVVVPDWVAASLEQEDLVDAELGKREWLDIEVKRLDPRLSVVWVKDRCDPHIAAMFNLKPGRWHVKRDNPDGVEPSFKAITGPNGEYRSPDSGVLEELRRQDMWHGDVARSLFDRHRAKQEREEKDAALRREQRRDDLKDNVKAALAPGVSFADTRWSNRPAGRRGRRS